MTETTPNINILLVEDNPGDAKLVEHHLGTSAASNSVDDIELTHVESLDRLDGVEIDRFDVLLLDLGLPGSSGLNTLDRASEMADAIPIIVLTGMEDREKSMMAIERGAQDYLPKGDLDGDRLGRALRYAVVRGRQQRTLRRRRDQMEFFNSILQHDMLNGMNVIRARAELLERELDGENRAYAETIVDWSDDIIDLTEKVRSVLDTLSEGGMTEMEQRDLASVLETAADRARSKSPACTVNNEVRDIEVAADELLEDVFANLFLNAVEHGSTSPDSQARHDDVEHGNRTGAGDDVGVTIDVSATVGDVFVTVRVADDGPGIDPGRRRQVFERGQKGSASSGTGFGLYFVDSMVESYGGNIWVEESEAGGAAFVIELPRTK